MSELARFPDDGHFGRFLRIFRHPLRALSMALAVMALGAGVTTGGGVITGVVGAILGVVAGELVGRTRVRVVTALVAFAALGVLGLLVAGLVTGSETLASFFGPANALGLSAMLRWGLGAFTLVGALRVAGARYPTAMGVELGVVVAAVGLLFAAHRDGVIARPLWISDWAWQKGIDPASIFLGLGGVAVVILGVLLVLEVKSGRTVSTLVSLPLLALLAVACLDVVGRPMPQAEDGLGLTTDEEGDPPNQVPDAQDDPEQEGPDSPSGGDGGGGHGEEDGGTVGTLGDAGSESAGGSLDGGQSSGDGLDGGAAGGADGGPDAAGGAGAVDGGPDGGEGGGGGGRDAAVDGGGAGGSPDAGESPEAGAQDGGADAGGSASDAGLDDAGLRPPPDLDQQQEQQEQQGQQQEPQPQQEQNPADGSPSPSPAPMAVVVLYDDYEPPSEGFYFRQETWSEWNGSRLVASTVSGVDEDTLDAFPNRRTAVAAPPEDARQTVRGRVAMLVEHLHPFALEAPVSFRPVGNPNPDRFVRAYEFESLAQSAAYPELLRRNAGDPTWSDEVRALYLTPHPDPRIAELEEQILQEADVPAAMAEDPFARALSTKLWLDRELIYSTRERHAGVEDPTIDFLFGNRIGYCVHFAHTAVFLYRAAGVPARVATGYMVPAGNRRGGSAILVRAADAHAWPEVYLEGVGWVVLDIAAARNLDEAGQPLDEDMQRMLGEMAREQPADPEQEIHDEEPSEGFELPAPLWALAAMLAAFVLLVLYSIKVWRRFSPAFASQKALPRVAYRAYLDRLAEVGQSRRFGETRESFASRVASLAPSFGEMTRLHVAARLAGPGEAAGPRPHLERHRWKHLGSDIRGELGGSVKLWRRLVGILHPVSFLDAR